VKLSALSDSSAETKSELEKQLSELSQKCQQFSEKCESITDRTYFPDLKPFVPLVSCVLITLTLSCVLVRLA
jgi:hypothetical protein